MSNELAWGFPLAVYLFLGGMSAAAYYIGVMADLVSKVNYKNVARAASYAVLAPMCLGLLLLVMDLGAPLRFWHLMLQTGPLNYGLIFLPNSPMSVGAWVLIAFTIICGILYPLFWLAEEKIARKLPLVSKLAGQEKLRRLVGIIGLPFAFGVVAYTGVLIAATSQPVWADTPLLPMLFVLSATSTGMAAIMLILAFLEFSDREGLHTLEKGDNLIIKLELGAIILMFLVLLLIPQASEILRNLFLGPYAVFFWVGFMFAGLALPLSIQNHSLKSYNFLSKKMAIVSSVLVLFGGLFLRYLILLAV